MDETMQNFLRNAKRLGLCEEYTDKWTAAKSKKQLLDVALDANGLSFVANAVAKGYLTAGYICSDFFPFINGKYIRHKEGYTSALYCSCGNDNDLTAFEAKTTALLVINFVGTITIPKNRICEMHLVNCKCCIKSEGRGNVYLYGDTDIFNKEEASIEVIER